MTEYRITTNQDRFRIETRDLAEDMKEWTPLLSHGSFPDLLSATILKKELEADRDFYDPNNWKPVEDAETIYPGLVI